VLLCARCSDQPVVQVPALRSGSALRAAGLDEAAAALAADAAGIADRLGYVVAQRRAVDTRPPITACFCGEIRVSLQRGAPMAGRLMIEEAAAHS
jgi:hypothetical protein